MVVARCEGREASGSGASLGHVVGGAATALRTGKQLSQAVEAVGKPGASIVKLRPWTRGQKALLGISSLNISAGGLRSLKDYLKS